MAKMGNKGGSGGYNTLKMRKPERVSVKRAGFNTGKVPSDNRIRRVEAGMQRKAAGVADGKC